METKYLPVEYFPEDKMKDVAMLEGGFTLIPKSLKEKSDDKNLKINIEKIGVSAEVYQSDGPNSNQFHYLPIKGNKSEYMLEEATKFSESDELILDREDGKQTNIFQEKVSRTLKMLAKVKHQDFSGQKYVQETVSDTAEKIKLLNCNFCGREFSHQLLFDVHVRAHSANIVFVCGKCGDKFSVEQDFEKHVRGHYLGEAKKMYCRVCGKLFPESRFEEHSMVHLNKIKYSCDCCSLRFTSKLILEKHLRTHLGGKYFKHLEDKESTQSCLTSQFNSKTNRYLCEYCGKLYLGLASFSFHIKTHNGVKKFQCKDCGMAFFYKHQINLHMTKHTKEKPFLCEKCKRAFRTKHQLTGHLRTHTGERPYQCNFCGRAFALENHLRAHERIHTGEKPFKCHECGAAFRQQTSLIYHCRKYVH